MSQYLPYSGFKWLNQKEISDFCLNSISENSPIGYILEVDLEYPSELHELHELHNHYLLAPEKLVNKLVPNLGNKSKYVVHYGNLQLYLSLGMKGKRQLIVMKNIFLN